MHAWLPPILCLNLDVYLAFHLVNYLLRKYFKTFSDEHVALKNFFSNFRIQHLEMLPRTPQNNDLVK